MPLPSRMQEYLTVIMINASIFIMTLDGPTGQQKDKDGVGQKHPLVESSVTETPEQAARRALEARVEQLVISIRNKTLPRGDFRGRGYIARSRKYRPA